MPHTPHELSDEFPEHADVIHTLKTNDSHFARLADAYHAVNREIHRAETRVDAISEEHEEELRKKRLRLKDEIAGMLAKAAV